MFDILFCVLQKAKQMEVTRVSDDERHASSESSEGLSPAQVLHLSLLLILDVHHEVLLFQRKKTLKRKHVKSSDDVSDVTLAAFVLVVFLKSAVECFAE